MTDLAWLVSDALKLVVIALQFLLSLLQLFTPDPKNDLKRNLHWAQLARGVADWFWMLTAHEPLYLGWRSYAICHTVVNVLIQIMALHLAYILLRANYKVVHLGRKLPLYVGRTYVTAAVLVVFFQVVGMALVLESDMRRSEAVRPVAALAVALFFGIIFQYSVFNLYQELKKRNRYSSDRSTRSTNALNRKVSEMKILTSRTTITKHEDAPLSPRRGEGTSPVRGQHPDSPLGDARMSCPNAGISISNLKPEQLEKALIAERRMLYIFIFCMFIILATVIGSINQIKQAASSNDTYSKQIDEDAREYGLLSDIGHWGRILVVIGAFQIYAFQRLPSCRF
mmetsp:Transcript_35532/g.69010  ORF Transcript_35532/g.69010 Transcript_35532/m.69010 type:complete len:340 (+) Transcript_35532:28-1047(+)